VLVGSGVAGCFAAGEIGPVGGRNFVHGFTASILAFGSTSTG
jgi:small ligand-binding sensory domain FIST